TWPGSGFPRFRLVQGWVLYSWAVKGSVRVGWVGILEPQCPGALLGLSQKELPLELEVGDVHGLGDFVNKLRSGS
ncbi:hypothetical protein NPIL_57581, partial [Nephila pilipes]